ncbi:unnamed protein product, partial [Urochloa humidicola]
WKAYISHGRQLRVPTTPAPPLSIFYRDFASGLCGAAELCRLPEVARIHPFALGSSSGTSRFIPPFPVIAALIDFKASIGLTKLKFLVQYRILLQACLGEE